MVGMGLVYVAVAFIALFRSGMCSWQRNQVTLEKGQYKNLLVAINKDVPENQQLVDEIKIAFTNGSSKLFDATHNRTYWKSITILVPKLWTHKPEYEPVSTESFDRANVVIDFPNPRWEDNPYTHQLGGCGEPGEYIHFTPNYLLDKSQSEFIWGPVDKLLIHEWGHLRWGLFDEYTTNDPGSAPFYATSDHLVEATRCSLAIKGQYVNIFTLKQCYLDPATGIYQPECIFYPDLEGQTATASIMYGQFLDSVYTYCHSDPSDPLGFHDVEAPHKHNIMCKSQSSWDVILKSDDFKNGNNPPMEGDVDTTPTFRIVQASDRRVVLVLDTSGSMQGDRIEKLLQATTHYLRYTIDVGSYVGIVHFNTAGYVLSELLLITNDTAREALVALLPTVATGGTSIGSGVLKGIDVLSRGEDSPSGGYLLVVSDGDNTNYPGIGEVLDDVTKAGVIVDTIAFSDEADNKLRRLSEVSGGLAYFFADDADSSSLNNAFTATITTRPDLSSESLPITLYSGSQTIPRGGNVSVTVYIDESVGLNTVFMFSWIADDLIEVWLESPDGTPVDKSQYNLDEQTKIITVKINDTAMPGYWFFTIANVNSRAPSQVVTVSVESRQSSDEEPIEVLALVSDPTINLANVPVVIIYAIVTKGYLPVLNVQVVAIIEGPDSIEEILLLDKGAEPDITGEDGVYSGYYFSFSDNGRYSITIKVDNSADTAVISRAKATGSLPIRPDTTDRELPAFEPTGMFVRTASGGAIEVTGFTKQPRDKLAPSRILDLIVLETSYSEQSVVLQWTAVGDDFDKGRAKRYELMAADNYSKLLQDFTNARLVTNDDLLRGNLSDISPAGGIEKVTLKVPTRGTNATYFFAIRAEDDSDNFGDVSNIVSANMEYIPDIPDPESQTRTALWATLGSLLGIAIIAGIVFGILRHNKTKKNKSTNKTAEAHVNKTFASGP